MRTLALMALAAALYLAPQAAFAQAQPQAPILPQVQAQVQAQAQKIGDVFGLSSNQVLAIGIGAAGGILIAEALHVSAAVVIGAIAGGAIGNWWYAQKSAEDIVAGVKK